MKKILTLVILAVTISSGSLFAQKQLYFGAGGTGMSTGFINQNTWDWNTTHTDWDIKATFSYGFNGNVGFDFNKNLGVKLELGYARLGQSYEDKWNDSLLLKNISLVYFQIPVLFKFRSNGEVAKFMFAVGPQFDFLMAAKQNVFINDVETNEWGNEYIVPGTTENLFSEDVKDRFSSYDIMARLDLGVEIVVIKNLFIDAGLSFAYGLTDINSDEWKNLANKPDETYDPLHNWYVGLNVGVNYVLPLK